MLNDQLCNTAPASKDSAPAAVATTGKPYSTHIRVAEVSVAYGQGSHYTRVLSDVNLEVERGAFVSLIGASGCGKSTLLKSLAGLVRPAGGQIQLAGLTPAEAVRRRLVGLVFQEDNLLPWKTTLDNAAFLLELADKSLRRSAAREKARAMLDLVGLSNALDKRPHQLSGGMRQRVAIARALTLDPEILLMDEPFGALDAITREQMSYSMLDIWERTQKTLVLVTHSITEAVMLSDTVHVMGNTPARIVQSIQVDLPRPRDEGAHASQRYRTLEESLRGLLVEHHKRGESTS